MTFFAVVLAATLSAGNAEFDKAAVDGARAIAVERAKAELVEKGPVPGALEKAMLADPKKYQTPEDAETLCRGAFAAQVKSQFAAQVKAIDARLGLESFRVDLESSRVDSTLKDSTPTLKDPKSTLSDSILTQVVEKHFASAFAEERGRAVEAQAKTIVAATRPTEADFDSKDDKAIRAMMLSSIEKGQSVPVFAENRQFISERMIDPVIKDARAEQKRQREYLMRARSDELAPSKLKADLKSRLEENVKDRMEKAEDPSKAWGVFAKTFERSVGKAVERRLVSRLEKKVEACELKVDVESLAKTIAEDPAAHVKAKESERLFLGRYAAQILATALDGACEEASDADRAELRTYLSERLSNARLGKSVESKLQKEVLPKWRKARAEAAAKQAAETWPTLEDRTWCPSPELADEVAAKSDYKKVLREWRTARGMEKLAKASGGRQLMEEANRRADAEVAAAFDLARGAIAAQNAIVDGCHPTVLAESRRRKDSFWTRTPDLKAIKGLLTDETEKRWDATRLATLWPDEATRPANASEQHRALFPSVKRKIELLAKVILEEMNEPKPEEEKKPEEKPPEDTPEEPPEEMPMFAISVKKSGDMVEVELKQGEKTVESSTVRAQKGEFEDAMSKVTKALSRLLDLR